MIDLHAHSTCSDGTLSPEAVVDLAADKGLVAIALTDHDTVAGIPAALKRGAARGIHVVPGLELGVRQPGVSHMHILGYYVDHENAQLLERLSWLQENRRVRARKIVERLNEAGAAITFERVEAIAGGESVGRPHVARALLEAGAVASIQEGFDRYLTPGKPGYAEKKEFTPAEGIALIRQAGGTAVLAHPASLRLDGLAVAECVQELQGHGLEGIEVFWSGHKLGQVHTYSTLARKLGLLMTGGSDFHGDNKPNIALGTGRGDLKVPDSLLTALQEHRAARAAARA